MRELAELRNPEPNRLYLLNKKGARGNKGQNVLMGAKVNILSLSLNALKARPLKFPRRVRGKGHKRKSLEADSRGLSEKTLETNGNPRRGQVTKGAASTTPKATDL